MCLFSDFPRVQVNLVVCWLVVGLALKEQDAQGLAFTLAQCVTMTLALTGLHTY